MWYECVQSAAESGYSKAMGTAKNLGHALFTKMDQRYKRILHSAIDNGSLRLRNHPDGRRFTDQEHIECVEKILNLVAKETTTDRVKRLIRMTREVYECRRGSKESFAEYLVRFESISRAYLSIAKARPDSQDEQNFAIMAIENANLPIATYNAIISNFVAHAKDNIRTPMSQVPADMLHSITEDIQELHRKTTEMNAETQSEEPNRAVILDVKRLCSSLKAKANDIPLPLRRSGEDIEDHSISLTKALEELQDIKTEDQRTAESDFKDDRTTPRTDCNGMDQSKQVATMMGGRDDVHKPKGKYRRDRSYYNQQRNSRKGKHGWRKQSSKNKQTQSHEGQSEEDDLSSDEESEHHRNKRSSVFDRLGKRHDSPRPHKKVRFDNREDNQENGDSETDSYFRKTDRRRS